MKLRHTIKLALAVAAIALFASSCTDIPITATWQGRYGTYQATTDGINIEIHPTK